MYAHLYYIRGKRMKQTVTQAQIDAHNQKVIAKTVAMQIWKQTSRHNTKTRYSTWNKRA